MSMRSRALTSTLMALVACCLAAVSADSMAQSCYSTKVPAPQVRQQTIVVVDRTTHADPNAVASFRQAAVAAASRPGQRVVVLSFAGIAPGQDLKKHLDRVIDAPISDPEVIENLPIRPFKASQKCVREALGKWPEELNEVLGRVIESRKPTLLERSEIVHALSNALRTFAAPGMNSFMYVYSDGLENGEGPGALRFYGRDGHSRKIDALAELARLPQRVRARPVPALGPVSVRWAGLLALEPTAQVKYVDAEALNQLQLFWTHLLTGWGVDNVQVERILLDAGVASVESRPLATAGALQRRP